MRRPCRPPAGFVALLKEAGLIDNKDPFGIAEVCKIHSKVRSDSAPMRAVIPFELAQ
jgi:hypothetical protein